MPSERQMASEGFIDPTSIGYEQPHEVRIEPDPGGGALVFDGTATEWRQLQQEADRRGISVSLLLREQGR